MRNDKFKTKSPISPSSWNEILPFSHQTRPSRTWLHKTTGTVPVSPSPYSAIESVSLSGPCFDRFDATDCPPPLLLSSLQEWVRSLHFAVAGGGFSIFGWYEAGQRSSICMFGALGFFVWQGVWAAQGSHKHICKRRRARSKKERHLINSIKDVFGYSLIKLSSPHTHTHTQTYEEQKLPRTLRFVVILVSIPNRKQGHL